MGALRLDHNPSDNSEVKPARHIGIADKEK
jgi:hypothetical protein